MSSSERTRLTAGLLVALAAACGGSEGAVDPPTVVEVRPACGDNAAATPIVLRGSMPVKAVVSTSGGSGTIDTSYRAWVGDVELKDVRWSSASEVTAVVPAGIGVGTYPVTVASPFGTRGGKEAAFQVRLGPCPVESAALVVASAIAAPATTTVGQTVTVTATVENVGRATALNVLASVAATPVGFVLRSGPSGPQDVPGGQARPFTWTFTASATGGGVFLVDAGGTAADTGLAVAAAPVSTNPVVVNPGAFLTADTSVVPTQMTLGQSSITVALTVTNVATKPALATPALVFSGPVAVVS